jgi:hypothetical protein
MSDKKIESMPAIERASTGFWPRLSAGSKDDLVIVVGAGHVGVT